PPALHREGALVVGGLYAHPLRKEPDLQQVDRLAVRSIVLAVPDAGPRAQLLHLSGPELPGAAGAVAMGQRSLQHYRQDLHVAVRVRPEAAAWRDPVFVDHPQRPEAHVRRVLVVPEREAVPAVQPPRLRPPPLLRLPNTDHRPSPSFASG